MKASLPMLVAAASVALVAACSTDHAQPAAPTVTVTVAPSATAQPSATIQAPITVTAAPSSPPVDAPPAPCGDADLTVSNKDLESQGSEYRVLLYFKNTSSHRCTLTGYPGADIVNETGPVAHAERRPQNAAPLLTLEPGDVATADLQSRDVHPVNDGASCPRWGSVVVIAPNTFKAHDLGIGMPLCTPLISSVT